MDRMTLKEEIRQHFDCRDYLRKSSGCSAVYLPVVRQWEQAAQNRCGQILSRHTALALSQV